MGFPFKNIGRSTMLQSIVPKLRPVGVMEMLLLLLAILLPVKNQLIFCLADVFSFIPREMLISTEICGI